MAGVIFNEEPLAAAGALNGIASVVNDNASVHGITQPVTLLEASEFQLHVVDGLQESLDKVCGHIHRGVFLRNKWADHQRSARFVGEELLIAHSKFRGL